MAIIKVLKRNRMALNKAGNTFSEVIEYPGDSAEPTILYLPIEEILPIAINAYGAPTVEFTNYPEERIEADTAIWGSWDGVSQVAPSITAVRVSNTSGAAASVCISTRTAAT